MDIAEQVFGEVGVTLDHVPFLGGQFSFLMQDLIGDRQLADVMQQGAPADIFELLGVVDAEELCQSLAQVCDPLAVAEGFAVVEFECFGPAFEGQDVGLTDTMLSLAVGFGDPFPVRDDPSLQDGGEHDQHQDDGQPLITCQEGGRDGPRPLEEDQQPDPQQDQDRYPVDHPAAEQEAGKDDEQRQGNDTRIEERNALVEVDEHGDRPHEDGDGGSPDIFPQVVQNQTDQARACQHPEGQRGQVRVDGGKVDRDEERKPQGEMEKFRMGPQIFILVTRGQSNPMERLHGVVPVGSITFN